MDGRSRRKIDIPIKNCEICGKEIIRNTKQGEKRTVPSVYIKRRFCSIKCRGINQSQEKVGDKNYHWKGGISTENENIRGSAKYKQWRLSVFSRDNFTCKRCNKRGGNIVAHHLEGFNKNKHLIFNISNGITLCECCHSSFHKKYGAGNNTLEQFLFFIK